MLLKPTLIMLYILIILQYMNPVADLLPNYYQIIIALLLIICIVKNKKISRSIIQKPMLSFIIFLMTLLMCIYSDRLDLDYFSPMQSCIERYQIFINALLFTYIMTLSNKERLNIFILSIACIVTTVIVSLYYILMIDPQAVRNTQGVSYYGVGDFQLMYAMAILSGPYLMYIKDCYTKKQKFFYHILCFALMMICLLLCNLVTSVVVSVVSIVISRYYFCNNKITKKIFFYSLIALLSLKNLIAYLLKLVAEKGIFYWSTNNKILAVSNLILGNNENLDTLSARADLTMISLNTFRNNLLFGVDFKEHVSGIVGGHAQWVDDLARFGFIGNIAIIWNYLYFANYSISALKKEKLKKAVKSAWCVLFILGFLNPCMSGTILMIILVVIPCIPYE